MSNYPLSVAIATFNSEKHLRKVLTAIQNQNELGGLLELLIIDGGSTDKTLKIAKEFGAKILENKKTEPVAAKFLAFNKAKSQYLVFLDHDEVLINPDSLKERLRFLKEHENVGAVLTSGYRSPKSLSFVNHYINEFGDPFSFFIYRLSKSSTVFLREMKKRYLYKDIKNHSIFTFSSSQNLPLLELCAAATLINKELVLRAYSQDVAYEDIPHFFYQLQDKGYSIAIHQDDDLLHYSSDTITSYLAKIRWRIKNNIFRPNTLGKSGFTGRQNYYSLSFQFKPYLYPLYAFSLIIPFIDSIWLAYTRKNINFLLHTFFTIYTASLILWFMMKKTLGLYEPLRSYDEKQEIK